ncbi:MULTISPECIES: cellulose binding domain-containing protein [Amycolatopsis]|uniref:cellulose binding domain-containing protein n=1 Tax=Amycolatopsis TaxID=1813 RepID=UPI00174C4BA0|nr:cellulose binding domain-containing protein [Amycolatopsis bullii]
MVRRVVVAVAAALLVLGSAAVAAGAPLQPAASTAGCGKAPTLTSGTRTIQTSGKSRNYILRIPDGYDRNHPYRLIFGFHWLGGTATDVDTGRTVQTGAWAYYGLQRLANNSAIFVAPQGFNNGWANSGGEDVTFTDDIIRQVEGDLCVDTTQLFSVGFSYGAAMSYSLACSRATVFRAVAVQSGGVLSGCSGGTQPIAYLGVHGLRDTVLNIAGGRSMRDRFVRNNGCTAQNPPEPAQGSLTHRVTSYAGCRAGYPVQWAAFDEGHIAAPQDGATGDSGSRTWVPALVWQFFSQFGTTTPPPDDPPPATGACRVAATVSPWNTGLTESITITNTGSAAISGWSLGFTLPDGQTITSGWSAAYAPSSGQVTATNVAYNAELAAGASTTIGFQANHTGNPAPATAFTLNGAACTTG